MPCQYALYACQDIAPMFGDAVRVSVIDMHTHEGVARMREVRPKLDRRAPVPSVIINERLAFGGVPDLDELVEAIKQAMEEG